MLQTIERRQNQRIRFSWPIWYGYDDNGEFHKGHIQDLSRQVVCFTIDPSSACLPRVGDHILTRFSFPLTDSDNFQIGSYLDWSEVVRADITVLGKVAIALRLSHPVELSVDTDSYSTESHLMTETLAAGTGEQAAEQPEELTISA